MEVKKLSEILRALDCVSGKYEDTGITGIHYDSRQIKTGNLFVAITGEQSDGHDFIPQALLNGAVAIIGTRKFDDLPVPYFQVDDSRLALALASAAFFDFPAKKLEMIGVTGTDGKTTTINLLYEILVSAGFSVGMISTVNAVIGSSSIDTGFHVTTPDAVDIQFFLRKMVDSGTKYAIIETTSHGLQQKRVASCEFDIGVITNITHEHLDYHRDFENYRRSKAILFQYLDRSPRNDFKQAKGAVLNLDDESFEYLSAVVQTNMLTYGYHQDANFRAINQKLVDNGVEFSIIWKDDAGLSREDRIVFPHIGLYNISNCLAAFTTAVGFLKVDPVVVIEAIANVKPVPGRMEKIDIGQGFLAIVDFAHTPNALYNAITTARYLLTRSKHSDGKIICVFGSAGHRDREKRHQMAEVSAHYADLTILTAEDPRTESLQKILDEMTLGLLKMNKKEGEDYWRIADRRSAIRYAVKIADRGDIILVCGKGHEQSMCFGVTEYPWDDRVALKAALCERLGIKGPEMPQLPPDL